MFYRQVQMDYEGISRGATQGRSTLTESTPTSTGSAGPVERIDPRREWRAIEAELGRAAAQATRQDRESRQRRTRDVMSRSDQILEEFNQSLVEASGGATQANPEQPSSDFAAPPQGILHVLDAANWPQPPTGVGKGVPQSQTNPERDVADIGEEAIQAAQDIASDSAASPSGVASAIDNVRKLFSLRAKTVDLIRRLGQDIDGLFESSGGPTAPKEQSVPSLLDRIDGFFQEKGVRVDTESYQQDRFDR